MNKRRVKNMYRKVGTILLILCLSGCASTKSSTDSATKTLKNVATIREIRECKTKDASGGCVHFGDRVIGVDFHTPRPGDIAWERGDVKFSYNTKAESFISKLMSLVGLSAVGSRK